MAKDFTPESLYRLPWNFCDNAISWLEPTSKCNLHCDGCYRENRNNSHKSLEEIREELDVFQKNRRTDSISVAGGEPLIHPNIVEITRIIADRGWKPVINTNGEALTPELLKKLKKAGVHGFTLHVDSGQGRRFWKNKNELELNELRQHLADMIHEEGGITCSFNATIYPENMKYVPDLVKWAQDNIDRVHTMVFILYRMAIIDKDMDFYVGREQVEFDKVMYTKKDDNRRTDVTSPELVDLIRTTEPDFKPAAFLNGTHDPDTYKWLLSGRLGNRHEIFGYIGPKFMEIIQTFKHLFTNSYLAYSTPFAQSIGQLMFSLGIFDKGVARAARNYFRTLFKNPRAFFSPVRYQSILIIQPADIHENGDINMCDGCPDMTVWNGKLVWSCRMEEQMKWGDNMHAVPKEKKRE